MWITEETGKAAIATGFYHTLFTSESQVPNMADKVAALPIPSNVTPEMNASLTAEVQSEEIRRTIFSMGSKQAPGSDEFTGKFFKAFWDIVGESVVAVVCSFFLTGRMLRSFNHTWLTLIPKVDTVETMKQLCSISLCQFVYKIITKIMAKRLACLLPQIISEGQNAFIRKGYMALKVDMEKAYDRVEWPLLLAVLDKMGINSVWQGWVLKCLRSSSFTVHMNGTPSSYFSPSGGLWQGDPLSPLLFVLCTEGFAALLSKPFPSGSCRESKWCHVPRIFHLFFADDSYLFRRDNLQECENLIEVLKEYEEHSGQRVNLAKSAVFFSKNIALPDQDLWAAILGVRAVGVHDKYLSLPKLIARSKMATFRYLEEKLLKRPMEILIKSITLAPCM
ncbi:unnamed protein product [Linum trigynum]|uniref:Reverse transcriptase domain-containing protein n=1 Tax=Linum trigynum TaxID=586398 RepID=A0AAV2EXJ8_9ROSI